MCWLWWALGWGSWSCCSLHCLPAWYSMGLGLICNARIPATSNEQLAKADESI